MKNKVLKNKEEKKEKLLSAAFQLMTDKDIHDISIAELASQAGIAKGTFYLYFKDKYDLRDFLVQVESEKILSQAMDRLEQNDIRDFEDSIIFLINQILVQLEGNPLLLTFIRHNLSWGVFNQKAGSGFGIDTAEILTRFTKRAKEAGYEYADPASILFIILELTSGVCYNAILFKNPVDMATIRPLLFDSIRSILHQGKKGKSA